MDNHKNKLHFFISAPHSCNYLEGREATSLFADPLFPKNKSLYTALAANGFRRSGEHLYKPYCSNCSECIPVRIPVNEFALRRHQKRNWRKNQDLTVKLFRAEFHEEHFQLYREYLASRHPDGGMDNPTKQNYTEFLWASWSDTVLYEFRLDKELVAVAVVDRLKDGLSSVYTFYDPKLQNRALGKYSILYLIEQTRQSDLAWLYLGYWIASCNKMKYKVEYQPIECFIDEEWKKFSTLPMNDFALK